ncbi:MAG: cell division protein ZapA [Peptostreptococcaceae bacterium]|nr:cell division protein ZapA [Peptostreptococcaceae bacterium]
MENNKVNVKIYGQEYTIAGEKSREQIIKVADYVDCKMTEISKKLSSGPLVSLAVLSAVNIADDYFEEILKQSELEDEIGRLRRDAHHFEQLWEETKKSFSHFKEELNEATEKNQELKRLLGEKTRQAESLQNEDKYKELESNYFDLQMENIRLKGELEKGKR